MECSECRIIFYARRKLELSLSAVALMGASLRRYVQPMVQILLIELYDLSGIVEEGLFLKVAALRKVLTELGDSSFEISLSRKGCSNVCFQIHLH